MASTAVIQALLKGTNRINHRPWSSFRRFLTINGPPTDVQTAVVKPLNTQFLPELFAPTSNTKQKNALSPPSIKTLIRSETLILRSNLIESSSPLPRKLAFIDGPPGVGKSTILSQLVAHARQNDFIVLFIPSARAWTDGPGFFCPMIVDSMDVLQDGPSAVRFYDRPNQTYSVLKNLYDAHAQALDQIPCTKNLASESTEACRTVKDLVSLGLSYLDDIDSNWRTIPSVVTDILHQTIYELSASKTTPFAIVIDDYYHMVGMTCMVNDRQRRLHANSIRTIAQFFGRSSIEHVASNIDNGFVLLASEEQPPAMDWKRSRVIGTADFPLEEDIIEDPSGRVWLKQFRRRIAQPRSKTTLYVRVSECAPGELKAMCATFSARGLRGDTPQTNGRVESDRLAMLAGGRGKQMARIFATR